MVVYTMLMSKSERGFSHFGKWLEGFVPRPPGFSGEMREFHAGKVDLLEDLRRKIIILGSTIAGIP